MKGFEIGLVLGPRDSKELEQSGLCVGGGPSYKQLPAVGQTYQGYGSRG